MKPLSFAAVPFALAMMGGAAESRALPALYSVRDFGAVGDAASKDTVAFQKALDTCAVNGGGEVLVPAGKYLIGSVQIGNRTILRLETNSVIIGSSDTNDYPMMDSLKSGRGMNGARLGKPTEEVVITHCTLVGRSFACIGIGSETSGGIRNVRIEHCKLTSRTYGVYIKTRIGRAGIIENISGDDLDVLGGGFLRINLISAGNVNTADDPVGGLVGYPVGRHFSFSNIRLTNAKVLAEASQIAPEKPLEGLSLVNIAGTCVKGISLANITGAELRDIHVTGYKAPFLTQTNVQGVGLDEPK